MDRSMKRGPFCSISVSVSASRPAMMSVGKAPAVFPAVSLLQDKRIGGYPAFVAAELAVHRGNLG